MAGALSLAVFLPLAAAQAGDTVLYKFTGKSDGGNPSGNPYLDSTGNLYGVALAGGDLSCASAFSSEKGCGVIYKLSPSGSQTVLHKFTGRSDGSVPIGDLTADSSGNLYGATVGGGVDAQSCKVGCGTVFRYTAAGKYKVLYAFTAGSDGQAPVGGVVLDSSGNIYGTTFDGGSSDHCDGDAVGCGTVFKLTAAGSEKILHTFSGGSSDGAHPTGRLVIDGSGNLFGETGVGGSSTMCGTSWTGCGTVFKVATNGTESLLHSFTGGSDGADPAGGLIADSSGNLYGTTAVGGSSNDCGIGIAAGCGTVFKIASNGTESVIHAFSGGSDGAYPFASLVMDNSGNLYGETAAGGSTASCGLPFVKKGSGCGAVFKIASNGKETILSAFKGVSKADGGYAFAGMTSDGSGNVVGVTVGGGLAGCKTNTLGKSGCGTVFKVAE